MAQPIMLNSGNCMADKPDSRTYMKYIAIILFIVFAIPAVRYIYFAVQDHVFQNKVNLLLSKCSDRKNQRQLKARLMEYEHLSSDGMDVQCQHSTALPEHRLPRPPIKKPKVQPKPKPLPLSEIESMLDQIKLIDIE